jgi:hypothetical protein
MVARYFWVVSAMGIALGACGGSSAGVSGMGGSGPGSGGSGNSTGTGGISGIGGPILPPGANGFPEGPLDLCAGLVQDKAAHPMTALAKPALGAVVTDAEFGTKIRRITAVSGGGSDPVIKPMYSTVSAWNADESRLMLLNVAQGRHELYDGRSYAFIRDLNEIQPADVEQVYWHTTDPDVFYYVDGRDFIRYHVSDGRQEVLTTFDFCTGDASGGDDPMFMSQDSNRIGLTCGNQVFIYDIAANQVVRKTISGDAPQMSASGNFVYMSFTGRVLDLQLNVVRTLGLDSPLEHASLGRLPTGEDTWNGFVYDDSNDNTGSLVTWDLGTGTAKVIIGEKTGYPYPSDGHVSAMAYRQPGWMVVSTYGASNGSSLLAREVLIADTVSGKVCRVGRHRSYGKDNTRLGEPYWAEAHAVPSPTGTRIAFGSDWGNGTSVDTYVIELASYVP